MKPETPAPDPLVNPQTNARVPQCRSTRLSRLADRMQRSGDEYTTDSINKKRTKKTICRRLRVTQ